MSGNLIEVFIDKVRLMALQKLAHGFVATNISLQHLVHLLAFDHNSSTGLKELRAFLTELKCTVVSQNKETRLDCKASLQALKSAPYKVRRCKK